MGGSFPVSVLQSFAARGILRTSLIIVMLVNTIGLSGQNQQIELIPAAKSTDLPEIDINCIVQDKIQTYPLGSFLTDFAFSGSGSQLFQATGKRV